MRALLSIMTALLALSASSQGIRDSVFQLNPVEIKADKNFQKESAGMKRTDVDSMVFVSKINLSLSQLLSENTPVFIKDYGRGALATASFRGASASHTQVNWNGIHINSPMTGMVDFSLIPVNLIDEVSLFHGGASIANRSGGLGGSVNIGNRVNWDQKLGVKFIQGIGSYRTFNEYLQIGVGNQIIQSNTRLYFDYSANDFTFINRNIAEIDPVTGEITHPLDTNNNGDYRLYGLLQELYLKANEQNVISVKYWFQQAERTIPRMTSYEGPNRANLNRQEDQNHRVVADWRRFGKKSRFQVRTGYAFNDLAYTLKNFVPGLGEVPAIFSENRQNSYLGNISYAYDFAGDFAVESRVDVNHHHVVSKDSVSNAGYDKDRTELSWLLAVRKSFFDRLNLNFMLRQDWIDFHIVPVMPYFGFDFRVIPGKELIIKGNIARNYHQPTLNDLYWVPGGNPDLLPEKGFSFESGAAYSFDINQHTFSAEITYFRSDIQDWIIWIPGFKGYWEPENIRRVLSQGVELFVKLDGSFGKFSYSILGNYAYTSSVNQGDPFIWGDESIGEQLPYIPRHSGNAFVRLAWKGFFITYQHNAYSERYTTTSSDPGSRRVLYPYFMNDVSVGKDFMINRVTLSTEFKVFNLFDETYHTILYRPMPGRNYLLTLMFRFE